MKKLISILTATRFSLVSTVKIIACQDKDKNKANEEIVGETIAQEILDGAIYEINSSQWFKDPIYMDGYIDDPDIKEIVPNIENEPEYIMMMHILQVCVTLNEKSINKNSNISKLQLSLDKTGGHGLEILLKNNLKKFKVVPATKNWFEDFKKVIGSKETDYKTYSFQLKFGKTLSKQAIQIKLFWSH